nr:reverse transcriptase domain-containing protein [Tanacetum cinerariifolium]
MHVKNQPDLVVVLGDRSYKERREEDSEFCKRVYKFISVCIEVDIEEDENEQELTYPYGKVDPLNPLPSASESEPEDVMKVNTVKSEDETVLASVHECGRRNDCCCRMIKESVDATIAAERELSNYKDGLRKLRVFLESANVQRARRMVEPERVKVDAYIWGLSKKSRNNQKKGNGRAMTTTLTEKKVPSRSLHVCKRCFTRHDGPCMIKCHKCGKVGHKLRYCKEKSVATGANDQPVWTCYDCEDQGHTRNRCPNKFKQEETEEVQVNPLLEIDLMPIKLGTFDVIIGMDWLVKRDAVIVCGEKVVRIPYGNKTLMVEGDKGMSRLKVISCIKARKYIERGCHFFLAHVTEKKPKEKRLEDVPVIHDFPEAFLDDLLGLQPLRQVEF